MLLHAYLTKCCCYFMQCFFDYSLFCSSNNGLPKQFVDVMRCAQHGRSNKYFTSAGLLYMVTVHLTHYLRGPAMTLHSVPSAPRVSRSPVLKVLHFTFSFTRRAMVLLASKLYTLSIKASLSLGPQGCPHNCGNGPLPLKSGVPKSLAGF